VNHGIPQTLIDDTFAEARRFHAQPMDAKLALRMNEHNKRMGDINALRRRAAHSWPPPPDVICQTQTPAALGASRSRCYSRRTYSNPPSPSIRASQDLTAVAIRQLPIWLWRASVAPSSSQRPVPARRECCAHSARRRARS
jgi:non-heme dioxygenase-like protein